MYFVLRFDTVRIKSEKLNFNQILYVWASKGNVDVFIRVENVEQGTLAILNKPSLNV